jgi:hypothetical protein
LLTSQLHPKYGEDARWSQDAGPDLSRLYAPPLSQVLDEVSRLSHMRGPRGITPADLPDLVTFSDVNNPTTVIEVDPQNLRTTLGEGISWNGITLESTDEPVTKGIEEKLPWLREYYQKHLGLDGAQIITKRDLANVLKAWDFDQSSELRRD